jgi:hypothetical protein
MGQVAIVRDLSVTANLDQVPEPLSAPAGPFGANGVSF